MRTPPWDPLGAPEGAPESTLDEKRGRILQLLGAPGAVPGGPGIIHFLGEFGDPAKNHENFEENHDF